MNHARKIKASKGKHYRWKIPFLKNGKMVHCESTLEKDFVRLADFDCSISEVIHQPIAIYYILSEEDVYTIRIIKWLPLREKLLL